MGGYKEVDSLNKEFQKAQKNWNKMTMKVDQQQQQYYRICHECIQNDSRAKQGLARIYNVHQYLFKSDALIPCLHYFIIA